MCRCVEGKCFVPWGGGDVLQEIVFVLFCWALCYCVEGSRVLNNMCRVCLRGSSVSFAR